MPNIDLEFVRALRERAWPWMPVGLLVVLSFLFLGDCWFGGKTLMMRDFFCNDQAHFTLFGRSLREGKPALWDPFRQCGVSAAAMPHHCTFYPPKLIFILPDQELACRCWWTFHFSLAAVSMYGLARTLGLGRPSSLLSGVTFGFGTFLMIWLEGNTPFVGIAWVPMVLYCVTKLLDALRSTTALTSSGEALLAGAAAHFRFSFGWIATLGLAWACQLLASGEFFYYTALLAAACVGSFLIAARKLWLTIAALVAFLLAAVIALGLAMPQLALTAELLSLSDRDSHYDPMIQNCSAHPRHWLIFLFPFLYGRPGYPAATWAPDIYELAIGHCHLGAIPILLLPFAFGWLQERNRPGRNAFVIWCLCAVAVFGLAMAAGKYTPLYMFLHDHLPGMGHFRFPTKFYLYVAVALSLLSAYGFDYLLSASRNDRVARTIFVAVFAAGLLGLAVIAAAFCSDEALRFLAGNPGPSLDQMQLVRADLARAGVFLVIGLCAVGVIVFRGIHGLWPGAAVIAAAFVNLLLVSRDLQRTTASGLHERRPIATAKALGDGIQYRYLSNYWSASQWIYGNPREAVFDWARSAGISPHLILEGKRSVNPGLLPTRRFIRFFFTMLSAPAATQEKLADMLGLRFVIAGAPFEHILWGNAPWDVQIIERPSWLPRAYGVHRWRIAADATDSEQMIVAPQFDPRTEAIVEPLPGVVFPESVDNSTQSSIPANDPDVTEIVDECDEVSMRIHVDRRTLWILNDAWYPGWKLFDNEMERPILRVNYLFRGVFLEPGHHVLRYLYRPPRFALGCLACLATALVTACVTLWSRRQGGLFSAVQLRRLYFRGLSLSKSRATSDIDHANAP